MAVAEISIQRTTTPRPRPPESELGFGRHFTDHMATVQWTVDRGWHDAAVVPYGPIALDPAAAVLHYAQEMFEGMKAFRGVDGKVRLWRPSRHCERMAAGAPRLCMPALPPAEMAQLIETLVRVDLDWVPSSPDSALYIRPTLIATEASLKGDPAQSYLFFVIASPVGAYYGASLPAVKIHVEKTLTRAAPGGLGAVKAGANYASGLYAAVQAKQRGFAQTLWLDGREHKYIEEVGTMNLFVVIGDELVTAPLSDSILSGVTRDCVLTIAREWGVNVSERRLAIDEIVAAHGEGQLREVFGTGTAAVVAPVGELEYDDRRMVVNDGLPGELSRKLYEEIIGIQRGARPDRYEWLAVVS